MPLPSSAAPHQIETGLSLLELLITLALAALVLGAGVPGLRHLVLESRMTAAVNDLVRDLHFARQTANTRAVPVVICPTNEVGGCRADGAWQDGWQVLAQPTDSPPRAEPTQVLRRQTGLPTLTIRSNRLAFTFRPFTLRDTNGTISFCDERGTAASRALVISPSGRPRLASRQETRQRVSC